MVPILGGGLGVLQGPATGGIVAATASADSHFRYLSGLLLGIGLAFLAAVPRIETHSTRVRLLAGIVVIGGLGRLLSVVIGHAPDHARCAGDGVGGNPGARLLAGTHCA
jgi:hypothetical protein